MSNRYTERAMEPDVEHEFDDEGAARRHDEQYDDIPTTKDEESDPLDDFNYVGSRHHY